MADFSFLDFNNINYNSRCNDPNQNQTQHYDQNNGFSVYGSGRETLIQAPTAKHHEKSVDVGIMGKDFSPFQKILNHVERMFSSKKHVVKEKKVEEFVPSRYTVGRKGYKMIPIEIARTPLPWNSPIYDTSTFDTIAVYHITDHYYQPAKGVRIKEYSDTTIQILKR